MYVFPHPQSRPAFSAFSGPDLRIIVDDYAALEPYISGKIMELHHKKHHQTYVTGLNSALDTIAAGDPVKAAAAAPLLNFHGGGHINHSLFWENLAPASREGGGEPDGALKVCFPPLPIPLPALFLPVIRVLTGLMPRQNRKP